MGNKFRKQGCCGVITPQYPCFLVFPSPVSFKDGQVTPLIPLPPLLSPKNGARRGVETGNMGVMGRKAGHNTQISNIFPCPQVGEGARGWGCPPLNPVSGER
jgi:hypothetical protein